MLIRGYNSLVRIQNKKLIKTYSRETWNLKYLRKTLFILSVWVCLLKNLTCKCKMFCINLNNELFRIILGLSGVLINQQKDSTVTKIYTKIIPRKFSIHISHVSRQRIRNR